MERERHLDRPLHLRRQGSELGREDDPAQPRRARRLERDHPLARRPAPTTRCARTGPTGPTHAFDPTRTLLDPYARGLARTPDGEWRGYVQDDCFDWGGVAQAAHPARPHRRLRGAREGPHQAQPRRAGRAARHLRRPRARVDDRLPEGSRRHRRSSCCPCTSRVSEQRLQQDGPRQLLGLQHPQLLHPARRLRHAARPSSAAPAPCCASSRAWCGCCTRPASRSMLDVVYNHTAEEGRGGPTSSLPRPRQRALLPADARRRLHRHHRMRQHRRLLARPPPSGSCSTRCATGRTRCRSTASASTWPPRSAATRTPSSDPSIRCSTAIVDRPAAARASR